MWRGALTVVAPMLGGALVGAVSIAAESGSFWYAMTIATILFGSAALASVSFFLLDQRRDPATA